ncbi:hypothetical protein [Flavobacterium sp. S87F.05.LMB.W.Kidney.N]|uniref:hypothetical protein n=1 Tax=Flavobacterium sp. S87F.05.LMB.W.Kidney.N TaxID=1278758 RepID=UPI001064BE79|nr:hypothetical protein [Flavobacterium sp. S87F.05.LMB.W.Kidney.N]TDX11226.1 hypothetical protein EDB96_2005 [Flavobacterium sp. S87F.05.LMB.W.Kidney.N]
MKKNFTLILFFILFSKLSAQAPFTTLAQEPNFVEKVEEKYKKFDMEGYVAANKSTDATTLKTNGILSTDTKESKDVDFFKNNSLALSLINKGANRLSVNSQVISYKIKVFTPVDKNTNYKYNIPFMLISKLSTSYDSISGASAIDVLDYEAAPITMRIMPSFKISNNEHYQEKMLFGFYADARGLNIFHPKTNDYSIEIVGSGGVGFTFQGDGEAGFYSSNGEYEPGKWLFSMILQGAVGQKEIIQSLFNTDKDYVTSFQSYFAFKIAENNKFNLKIGYQHFFQETIAGNNNNFSIAIGL